ncbi:MAG: CRISPR-associated endonuclease Cas2 [Nitrospira sp. SG-bin1]|nr:MAG: CRISPR-associated endonuclease Cas2 [Nitrospira sp. SG-bin1]
MAEDRNWYLISYDIREPRRWRGVFKLLKGYGQHLQYSIFRCRLTKRQMERLRWELACLLDPVDSLMVACLCPGCSARLTIQGGIEDWSTEEPTFQII